MNKLGSGENGEFTFLDIVSIVSFLVGIQNLDMNITQEDMQTTENRLDQILREQIKEIHQHLEDQDKKIDAILGILKENGGVIILDDRK